jgi:hypothetical protein
MCTRSKPMILLTVIAKGVLFSVAFTVSVRLVCPLLGFALTEHTVGNLLMLGSMLTGTLSVLLYSKAIKALEAGERTSRAGRN